MGYALLGACCLIWKTEGPLHDQARLYARILLPALLVALAAVSLATPFLEEKYHERWFVWPGLMVTVPMPLLVGLAVLIPLILAYTAWAYWVFRGKVGDEGYH